MRFFSEKQASPVSSLDNNASSYPYPGNTYSDYPQTGEYDDDLHVQCPPHTTERKLVARIDWRVIPCLCIMYRRCRAFAASRLHTLTKNTVLAFLDRVNIANANVYGLSKQLGLTGHEYNIALVIFFVPFVEWLS